jgi:sigma-B regulation protein RsbU (phosphoserine phosphatase)
VNILLAEDDAVTRRVLISQLKKLGHIVTEAEDGKQALACFQVAPPQVLITDWMMPIMDGPTLCTKIREEQTKEYTYIIILTALEKKTGYTEGMKAGADDFISKPADIVELNVRLRVAERIVRLQKEVAQLKGLLPICSKCKKIRVAESRWEQVESYITKRSVAQFSHGICPSCYAAIVQPQLEALKQKRNG